MSDEPPHGTLPSGKAATIPQTRGLDCSLYVDVENGYHLLTGDRLWDIADALGVTASSLLTAREAT